MTKRKKFIIWPGNNFPSEILAVCPFKVELGDYDDILTEDIENFVEGAWSSFTTHTVYSCQDYFFELESDAMAFKLRWS